MAFPLRKSIGYNKTIVVRKNGDFLNVYINDNVFEDKKLVPEKSKSVWLKWNEMRTLRDAINSIISEVEESHAPPSGSSTGAVGGHPSTTHTDHRQPTSLTITRNFEQERKVVPRYQPYEKEVPRYQPYQQ